MDYNLIVPFIPNLRRYARALVGDRDGADDLVQDTLERAVRKFHLWRPGDLRAWLFSIMHNVFVNQLKARKIGYEVEIDEATIAAQNALLKRQSDAVLTEPIPARMYMKRPPWLDYARAAVFITVGIAIGLSVPWLKPAPPAQLQATTPLPARAARAHLVYSPEVRHPVEVDAKEQEHLVKWLSKRPRLPLPIPKLASQGLELLGGRLLPGQ